MQPQHVVILGGGFGGLATVKELAEDAGPGGRIKTTLIDRNRTHLFTPLLYEAATGFFKHETLASQRQLRMGVQVDMEAILHRWHAEFVQDEIVGVDWERKLVLLAKAPAVAFDVLVIAIGSETNYFGIPGLAEHALPFKSTRDAERIRQRVQDLLYRRGQGKEKRIDIMVGGAGATGVEFAGEVTLFLRKHIMAGRIMPEDFEISIVEARSRVLPMFDAQMSGWAAKRLQHLGVRLHLDTCVRELHRGSVTLAPRPLQKGETVDQLLCSFRQEEFRDFDADIFVWTGGVRGSSTLERLGIPLDDVGRRIHVNDMLEVPDMANVFAIGDSVVLMDPHTKRPVTWLAQAAMVQGETVACNIKAKLRGGTCRAFHFPPFPTVVTVGGKWAVAVAGPLRLRGLLGWLLREAADIRYFLAILPPFKALAYWWYGLKLFSQND